MLCPKLKVFLINIKNTFNLLKHLLLYMKNNMINYFIKKIDIPIDIYKTTVSY